MCRSGRSRRYFECIQSFARFGETPHRVFFVSDLTLFYLRRQFDLTLFLVRDQIDLHAVGQVLSMFDERRVNVALDIAQIVAPCLRPDSSAAQTSLSQHTSVATRPCSVNDCA